VNHGILDKDFNGLPVKAAIEFAYPPVTGTPFHYVWNGTEYQTGRVQRSEKASEQTVIFVVDEGHCYALSYYGDDNG
jgi:hypothetical protein